MEWVGKIKFKDNTVIITEASHANMQLGIPMTIPPFNRRPFIVKPGARGSLPQEPRSLRRYGHAQVQLGDARDHASLLNIAAFRVVGLFLAW